MDRPILYTWNKGAALAYQIVGDGSVDLIYLSGAGSNLEWNWRYPAYAGYLHRLASFSRLILTDRRGWGCSDRFPPGRAPELDDLVDDLMAVREAAAGKPPALMAVNESGWAAIAAAALRPEAFSRLILFGCSPVGSRRDDMPWEVDRGRLESSYRAVERVINMADWIRVFVRDQQPSLRGNEDAAAWLTTLFRLTAGAGAAAAEVRSWADIDLRQLLPGIAVPTLVLSRPAADYWPPASARYLAARIPNAELVELPGEDGYPWVGDWESVTEQVRRFIAAEAPESPTARVLSTMLFTDIVESARHSAELGDRTWHRLLDSHNQTIRRLLAQHKGREMNTTGDGFFASFDVPQQAVSCGLEIVRAVRILGLEVRVGIHTGECDLIDDKLAGAAVTIGARIAGAAAAGEVLVSNTVKSLVTGSDIPFVNRGEHKLKGFDESWPLYEALSRRSE
ncbi:MAG TPA: adenylate/guanylate cyclase domain-containing protein [Candidatus Dormibacteraeota bacterium]|nr:adenylate/guanylate cyclase domain-containing protein [Candidatus Dormibacteraeota bacterium]